MGFDAVFINRISETEKERRRKEKTLEYVHFPQNFGEKTRIFEHILDKHYVCPIGFELDKDSIWNLDNLS